jgi:hypothetical protein
MKRLAPRPRIWLAGGVAVIFVAGHGFSGISPLTGYVTRRFGVAPSHLTDRDIAEFRRSSSP